MTRQNGKDFVRARNILWRFGRARERDASRRLTSMTTRARAMTFVMTADGRWAVARVDGDASSDDEMHDGARAVACGTCAASMSPDFASLFANFAKFLSA